VRRKGLRLDAIARFQVWAGDANSADAAIANLNMLLLSDRATLWAGGFLKLALEDTPLSQAVGYPAEPAPWRGHADYRLLFEFDYQSADGADSVIAQIPVGINGELGESMTISDEMTRWDNLVAPRLVARGAIELGSLSMLAFVPKLAPAAKATLLRSYDGAPGNPKNHANLKEFLAAISGANPERNSMVSFASFSDFMAAFQNMGASVAIGDWDGDGVTDQYQSLTLSMTPAIQLPTVQDRFEVIYGATKFNQVAVVYLRAIQG